MIVSLVFEGLAVDNMMIASLVVHGDQIVVHGNSLVVNGVRKQQDMFQSSSLDSGGEERTFTLILEEKRGHLH